MHTQFAEHRREELRHIWLREALKHAQADELKKRLERDLENKQRETKDDRAALDLKKGDRYGLQQTLEAVRSQAMADPKHDELQRLVKERGELDTKIQQREDAAKSIRNSPKELMAISTPFPQKNR